MSNEDLRYYNLRERRGKTEIEKLKETPSKMK